jgi:hypothetical protein
LIVSFWDDFDQVNHDWLLNSDQSEMTFLNGTILSQIVWIQMNSRLKAKSERLMKNQKHTKCNEAKWNEAK